MRSCPGTHEERGDRRTVLTDHRFAIDHRLQKALELDPKHPRDALLIDLAWAGSGTYLPCGMPQPIASPSFAQAAPNPLATWLGIGRRTAPIG